MQKVSATILRISFFIAFLLIATGCVSRVTYQPVPIELTDQSILTGDPCKAPCWYDLIPNQSSKQEALDVLAKLSFIDSATIRVLDDSWWGDSPGEIIPALRILAFCVQPVDEVCIEIEVIAEKIRSIRIFPNYRLTFAQVIEQFGEPDYVRAVPFGVECLGGQVALLWQQNQQEIWMYHRDARCRAGYEMIEAIRGGEKIPPDLEIEEITYFGSLPEYLQAPLEHKDIPWLGLAEP